MKLIDSLISFKKTFGRQGNDFGSFQINDTKFSNSNNLEDMYNIILFNEPIVIGGEFSMDIYPQINYLKCNEVGLQFCRKTINGFLMMLSGIKIGLFLQQETKMPYTIMK